MTEQVRAEMVANVMEVVAGVGTEVAEGDTIVLLESMKMEIPVLCEVAGRLEAIHVREGDPIGEGQPVATIAG